MHVRPVPAFGAVSHPAAGALGPLPRFY